jgi:hypothetical protein
MADDNTPADNGANRNATMLGVRALSAIVTALGNIFPQTSGTATSATAGAATLPANPVGFIVVTLPNGTSAKVPYYT